MKIMYDSRVYTSIYRTDVAGGETGPTVFLTSGKKCHTAYTGDHLRRHGAAGGSTVAITDNGCRTIEPWEELTSEMAKGIRNLPIIRDATAHWWFLKIIIGFGPHTASLKYM